MTGPPAGVRLDAVAHWLGERIEDLQPPLEATLITGGHSNLTYELRDGGGRRWVLRRPPLHGVLPSAHDMGREHMILRALQDSGVPVPATVDLCEDEQVTGAPFYVTDFVDGIVVREVAQARALPQPVRATVGAALVDTLAVLHQVDPETVGLQSLVRRTPYLERQLRRWRAQLEHAGDRDLTTAAAVHEHLVSLMPPAPENGCIVHGDYRLDNVIVGAEGDLRAVLDWELCAVGDPLADLGLMLAYWAETDGAVVPFLEATTALAGFPTHQQIVERYGRRTGRDLDTIDYYQAFGCWKIGVIAEGVAARYRSGAMGAGGDLAEPFIAAADRLFERAATLIAA